MSWQGSLDLSFGQRQGQTQVIYSHAQAPLKVQRSFHPEGPICHSVVLHTAGGIVGGDRLTLKVQLQPKAQALITTAAAAKIYRSPTLEAQQTLHLHLGTGACLEWLPQETIVFNGAMYRQRMRVELAEAATWLGWEITRFGRSARGERFLQGSWRSHTEVWRQGRPLWIDPQGLLGGSALLHSPNGLHHTAVVGSLAWVGRNPEAELIAKIRDLWDKEDYQGEAGVTRLLEGVLCRYRGPSTQEARHWFLNVWNLLRLAYWERPACPPRVWPS
jgi:urease accessory protein